MIARPQLGSGSGTQLFECRAFQTVEVAQPNAACSSVYNSETGAQGMDSRLQIQLIYGGKSLSRMFALRLSRK
jgi:hypothetical protein